MVSRAIITTTINAPHNLFAWSRELTSDDHIIVAGDLKTPHRDVVDILSKISDRTHANTVYIHPSHSIRVNQSDVTNVNIKVNHSAIANVVGYNVIQRRNLALLEAISHNPDIVITIDDDNYPGTSSWMSQMTDALMGECRIPVTATKSGWYNPGGLCIPAVTHRGYPLTHRHKTNGIKNHEPVTKPCRIGVFASLWLGDPDIDATERIVSNPNVRSVAGNAVLASGTWAPFNSQATAYRGELAPLMMMWPDVGRFDDIWASYAARAVMDVLGWHVRYGHPVVTQERNEHDLVKDLNAELFGYTYNTQMIEILRDAVQDITPDLTPMSALRRVFSRLRTEATFLHDCTLRSFNAWIHDLETVGVK